MDYFEITTPWWIVIDLSVSIHQKNAAEAEMAKKIEDELMRAESSGKCRLLLIKTCECGEYCLNLWYVVWIKTIMLWSNGRISLDISRQCHWIISNLSLTGKFLKLVGYFTDKHATKPCLLCIVFNLVIWSMCSLFRFILISVLLQRKNLILTNTFWAMPCYHPHLSKT